MHAIRILLSCTMFAGTAGRRTGHGAHGRILALGRSDELLSRYRQALRIDARRRGVG